MQGRVKREIPEKNPPTSIRERPRRESKPVRLGERRCSPYREQPLPNFHCFRASPPASARPPRHFASACLDVLRRGMNMRAGKLRGLHSGCCRVDDTWRCEDITVCPAHRCVLVEYTYIAAHWVSTAEGTEWEILHRSNMTRAREYSDRTFANTPAANNSVKTVLFWVQYGLFGTCGGPASATLSTPTPIPSSEMRIRLSRFSELTDDWHGTREYRTGTAAHAADSSRTQQKNGSASQKNVGMSFVDHVPTLFTLPEADSRTRLTTAGHTHLQCSSVPVARRQKTPLPVLRWPTSDMLEVNHLYAPQHEHEFYWYLHCHSPPPYWPSPYTALHNTSRLLPRRTGFNSWRGRPLILALGIVPDDATGQRVFSWISRLPPPFHSDDAPYSPRFTLIGSQDLDVKRRPNAFTLIRCARL
ncbi:hypothetical protein PR048_028867 [Dryococelus australis]|uniref:Uncharacterized protein n=1 Tax=Dryococelus australis TaxID=614101 RepID=A0ABQ9GBR9_9NEOP|nr:hypothetical protein PR048_028867 [Dryococelus australis]